MSHMLPYIEACFSCIFLWPQIEVPQLWPTVIEEFGLHFLTPVYSHLISACFFPLYVFFVLVLYFFNLKNFLCFIHGSFKWLSFLLSEVFDLSVRELRPFRLKCVFQLFGLHNFYLIWKIDLEFFSFGEKYLFYFKFFIIYEC